MAFDIDLDKFILENTVESLCKQYNKKQLSELYKDIIGSKPRSNMSKNDIAHELVLSVKYIIRNKELCKMS